MSQPDETPGLSSRYEERLRRDRRWSMDEGDRHFQREDSVFKTLTEDRPAGWRRLGVPYAVAAEWRWKHTGSAALPSTSISSSPAKASKRSTKSSKAWVTCPHSQAARTFETRNMAFASNS